MMDQIEQIPSEVWNLIFGYLTVKDKLSVRGTCKHFKRMVDHWSLWKDWRVVLTFPPGGYSSRFWALLRQRRVSCAVMRSSRNKDWRALSISLPTLTTLVIEKSVKAAFRYLSSLPNLSRLAIRSRDLLSDRRPVIDTSKITHLSACNSQGFLPSQADPFNTVFRFYNLTHLYWHNQNLLEMSIRKYERLLCQLRHLKHLSVSIVRAFIQTGIVPDPAGRPYSLSSLELVSYVYNTFPKDAMKISYCLDRLSVSYRDSSYPDVGDGEYCSDLTTWFKDLRNLSSLVIRNGPPVSMYVTSIPGTVTSLRLSMIDLSSDDLAAIAGQLPNLINLTLDAWPSYVQPPVAQIPELFPKLQHLKLRYKNVTENDFLYLDNLKDLKYLEVLDFQPCGPELGMKLRQLTGNRLQVSTSPRPKDALSCCCVYYGMF